MRGFGQEHVNAADILENGCKDVVLVEHVVSSFQHGLLRRGIQHSLQDHICMRSEEYSKRNQLVVVVSLLNLCALSMVTKQTFKRGKGIGFNRLAFLGLFRSTCRRSHPFGILLSPKKQPLVYCSPFQACKQIYPAEAWDEMATWTLLDAMKDNEQQFCATGNCKITMETFSCLLLLCRPHQAFLSFCPVFFALARLRYYLSDIEEVLEPETCRPKQRPALPKYPKARQSCARLTSSWTSASPSIIRLTLRALQAS